MPFGNVIRRCAGRRQKKQTVSARSLLCYWLSCELGLSQAWLARRLGISQPAVSSTVERGRGVAEEKHYTLYDNKKLIIWSTSPISLQYHYKPLGRTKHRWKFYFTTAYLTGKITLLQGVAVLPQPLFSYFIKKIMKKPQKSTTKCSLKSIEMSLRQRHPKKCSKHATKNCFQKRKNKESQAGQNERNNK